MTIDSALETRLRTVFRTFDRVGAANAFSPPATLSQALESIIPAADVVNVNVEPKIARYFATASVDVWLRAVHSFLVSASLTNASPLWASVSGYYSSHYVVRALAHLLGYFLLFGKKRVVQLSLINGRHICSFTKRTADDREHKLYWNRVKQDNHFNADPFFTENNTIRDWKARKRSPANAIDASDITHRDHANYADHLFPYPHFRALDENALRARIGALSQIEITDPPVPRLHHFPDVENVQLVAYHRIIKYRRFLDEILIDQSRFWNVHRNPPFTVGFLTFQVTESTGLGALRPK